MTAHLQPEPADERKLQVLTDTMVAAAAARAVSLVAYLGVAVAMLTLAIGGILNARLQAQASALGLTFAWLAGFVALFCLISAFVTRRRLNGAQPRQLLRSARPTASIRWIPCSRKSSILAAGACGILGLAIFTLVLGESPSLALTLLLTVWVIGATCVLTGIVFPRVEADVREQIAQSPALREALDEAHPPWLYEYLDPTLRGYKRA